MLNEFKSISNKSAYEKREKVSIPILEKILVDLFVDKKLFAPFQGNESAHIYNNIYKSYSLNITMEKVIYALSLVEQLAQTGRYAEWAKGAKCL